MEFIIGVVLSVSLIILYVMLIVCMMLFIRNERKFGAPQNSATGSPVGLNMRRGSMFVDASALNQRRYSAAAEFDAVLKHYTQDLSKAFIEQQRLAQWIEELASKGELNPAKLATTAEQQAYTLVIKMAEDKVNLAASTLDNIRQELCAAQKELSYHTKNQCFTLAKDDESVITQLTAQESDAQKMLTEAQKALSALTKPLTAEPVKD